MKKLLFFAIIILGLNCFLASCGQSGRLYLPAQPVPKPTQGSNTSR